MFIKLIFYLLMIIFVWRILKSIFGLNPGERAPKIGRKNNMQKNDTKVDKSNMEDANFEDLDN